ncbi:hypothetical protein [Emticicia soli]|uniref:DUF2306 domain-containing protein n=1 Tax=Emticicia soli TaxID=2027878 RepID=A0ABW5JD82_9BACT
MEKRLQNNIVYFFIAVLLISVLGFYPTYFKKFPAFEGLNIAHHVHGLLAILWILMLIAQAFLIRARKYALHRILGKSSYVLMFLLILSIYWVSRVGYYRNIQTMSEADTLAQLTNGIPDIFYLATLYVLGMAYKKRVDWHLRFFALSGLLILAPGLARYLGIFLALPNPLPIVLNLSTIAGIPLVWLFFDIRNKKSPVPILIFLLIFVIATYVLLSGYANWWQAMARWIVRNVF